MEIQNFGIKALEHVVLKATRAFTFGSRNLEVGEPVLYFKNLQIGVISEQSRPVIARGGWGNMPLVIWEDRNELTFQLTNGVMNQLGLGVLLSANVASKTNLTVPYFDEEIELDEHGDGILAHSPNMNKRIFVYENRLNSIQERITEFQIVGDVIHCGAAKAYCKITCDYYFNYDENAIVYTMNKERFNGTFSLEGMFYLKDENDGLQHSGILIMPKVRIVSGINLRMGERADPTISTFQIVAQPEKTEYSSDTIAQIHYLDNDIIGI